MSFLSGENNKQSSQRLSLIGGLIAVFYLLLVMGIYILKRANCELGIGESEWFGMSAFTFGLLAGLGINAGVKAYQKKHEKGEKDE